MVKNLWHDIDAGKKEELNVIIEIPQGSRVKYELDKETGLFKFDRVLYSPMHYPANYGFVPKTLWDDKDPLDVFVLGYESLFPGTLVKARPIGALDMNDGGDDDVKILAVPIKDPRFDEIKELSDVQPHILKEIAHFFKVYKDLQNKKVEVGEWKDREKAYKDIEKSFKLYNEQFSQIINN